MVRAIDVDLAIDVRGIPHAGHRINLVVLHDIRYEDMYALRA